MTVFNLLKIISSENKIKIIAHFWDCTCKLDRCVTDIKEEMNLSQSSLSKHLTVLEEEKVLNVNQIHKNRYYEINQEFKDNWKHIVDVVINSEEIKTFKCKHCIYCKH